MASEECSWRAPRCLLWFVDPAGAIPLESWDDIIPSALTRFKVLTEFGGAAVLDKETQVVWEQAPAATFQDWNASRSLCIGKSVGGRKGWRLPSIVELSSLINLDPPFLPTGHPFTVPLETNFWSATTDAGDSTKAWFQNVTGLLAGVFSNPKTSGAQAWCVRCGMNADAY